MSIFSKVFSLLICIFLIQTLGSCFLRCDDAKSYTVSYQSVDIVTFDTSGFTLKNADSVLYKNAFALRINLQTEEKEISDYRIASSIGFNTASALQECEDAYFTYEDEIDDIQIIRIEEEGKETNMTSAFSNMDYNGKKVSIAEMVEAQNEDYGPSNYRSEYFNVELNDFKDLPKMFKLRVEVKLKSGTLLISETEILYFVD